MKDILGAACILMLPGCAVRDTAPPPVLTTLRSVSETQVSGTVGFFQLGVNRVRIFGEVIGHSPGRKGFHIHEMADCSAHDAMSAGGHFNPRRSRHGASPNTGHVGDLGNLTFDQAGRATIDMTVEGITMSKGAPNSIVGRALMVHMQEDDLKTDPTGNAGARAACGVIGKSPLF